MMSLWRVRRSSPVLDKVGYNLQIVKVHPAPMVLIRGATAPEAPAPKRYWNIYLPLMTSDLFWGRTSTEQISKHPHLSKQDRKLWCRTSSIGIQPTKCPHQTHTPYKTRNNRYRQPTNFSIQSPTINQARPRKSQKHQYQTSLQSILWQSNAPSFCDIFLHHPIWYSSTKQTANETSSSWSDVEEPGN